MNPDEMAIHGLEGLEFIGLLDQIKQTFSTLGVFEFQSFVAEHRVEGGDVRFDPTDLHFVEQVPGTSDVALVAEPSDHGVVGGHRGFDVEFGHEFGVDQFHAAGVAVAAMGINHGEECVAVGLVLLGDRCGVPRQRGDPAA